MLWSHFDERGRPTGFTRRAHPLITFTLGILTLLAAIFPFVWPLVFLQDGHGHDGKLAWLAELGWIIFLIAVVTGLARHGRRVQARHRARQLPHAQFSHGRQDILPAPGPRDWAPPDSGRRLI